MTSPSTTRSQLAVAEAREPDLSSFDPAEVRLAMQRALTFSGPRANFGYWLAGRVNVLSNGTVTLEPVEADAPGQQSNGLPLRVVTARRALRRAGPASLPARRPCTGLCGAGTRACVPSLPSCLRRGGVPDSGSSSLVAGQGRACRVSALWRGRAWSRGCSQIRGGPGPGSAARAGQAVPGLARLSQPVRLTSSKDT